MAFVECPHCYTRVLVSAAGQCPACSKNTKDPRLGSAPPRTKTTIREGVRLPAICYNCGTPTDRTTTIRHRWQAAGDSRIVRAMAFWVAPGWVLLSWLLGRSRRPSMRVRLPECVSCSQVSTPTLEHTDFGAGEITLVVHKNFRAAMAARTTRSTR
jgi:hypothetical protein